MSTRSTPSKKPAAKKKVPAKRSPSTAARRSTTSKPPPAKLRSAPAPARPPRTSVKPAKPSAAKSARKAGPSAAVQPVLPPAASVPLTTQQKAERLARAMEDSKFTPGVDEGLDPGFFPSDEVLDEGEMAQFIQLKEQAAISARARELNRPEFHPDFDGKNCVECGEAMPKGRLELKRVRCVDCQSFLEADDARRRRLMG